MAVGGNDRPVIQLHQQCRIVLTAVGINHQPREIGQNCGAIKCGGQFMRYTLCADIKRDVPLHVRGVQPKVAATNPIGHAVRCMIACDQPAARSVGAINMKRRMCHVTCHSFDTAFRLVVKRLELRISGATRGVTANGHALDVR